MSATLGWELACLCSEIKYTAAFITSMQKKLARFGFLIVLIEAAFNFNAPNQIEFIVQRFYMAYNFRFSPNEAGRVTIRAV